MSAVATTLLADAVLTLDADGQHRPEEMGRLVQPIGPGGRDDVTLFEKRTEGLMPVRTIVPAHFVQLRGRYGYGEKV